MGSIETDMMISFGERYLDPDNAVHFHRILKFLHSDESTTFISTLALRVWDRLTNDRLHSQKTTFILLYNSNNKTE